uniref:Pectin acetylesterase 8-like n=1 Tax=Rhizophora mucronata TaxID=61149 RepID=A0A2P2LP69_RHIMU
MVDSGSGRWLSVLACFLLFLKTDGLYVPITYVKNAVAKGAGEKFEFHFSLIKLK